MEAFLVSIAAVAAGEIGDKTQLLALLLASRLRAPVAIVLGILCATLANHALAGLVGVGLGRWLGPTLLRWLVGLSFLALAGWALVPDRAADDGAAPPPVGALGAFGTTVVCFFMAEIGDKTQLVTVALAAEYNRLAVVVAGTTLGMMLADVPAVLLGNFAAHRIPFKLVRVVAAALFAGLGLLAIASALGIAA
ncbi:MAG TPA: TMEM165/GDT1 family protein [Candidatus Sulfotelmatobacter sp.]|nr:TMEM165/GDT1 family protein [Candidatus Sulfotelmatobacter sp.]